VNLYIKKRGVHFNETKGITEIQQEHYKQAQGIPAQRILPDDETAGKFAGQSVKETGEFFY